MGNLQVNLDKIKQLRIQRGMTLAYVSAELGFATQQGYYYKESGRIELTAVELGKLAVLYGVSADDLLIPGDAPQQCVNQ